MIGPSSTFYVRYYESRFKVVMVYYKSEKDCFSLFMLIDKNMAFPKILIFLYVGVCTSGKGFIFDFGFLQTRDFLCQC